MADSNSLVSDRRPCEAVKYLVLTRRLKRGSALNIISGAELRSLGLACGIIKVGPLRSRAAGDKEACKQKRHPHATTLLSGWCDRALIRWLRPLFRCDHPDKQARRWKHFG